MSLSGWLLEESSRQPPVTAKRRPPRIPSFEMYLQNDSYEVATLVNVPSPHIP